MGFTFNLNKTKVEFQKNGKKIKFEKEDYKNLFKSVSKISRRLKRKKIYLLLLGRVLQLF